MLKVGILVASDRASKKEYMDKSGIEIENFLKDKVEEEIEFFYEILPDELELIKNQLNSFVDKNIDLILTTGGTGVAKRDVTPEATLEVCNKLLPGIPEVMRSVSFKITPTAILSRQVAGIKNNSLIINLPGNPKAIKECLEPIFIAIIDCLNLLGKDVKLNKNIKFQKNHKGE